MTDTVVIGVFLLWIGDDFSHVDWGWQDKHQHTLFSSSFKLCSQVPSNRVSTSRLISSNPHQLADSSTVQLQH
eukprot:982151-Rhodomonas_salina.1